MLIQLFNNYLTAKLVILAKNEGLIDLFLKNGKVKEVELCDQLGMEQEGAAALLRYMKSQSIIYEENGVYFMEPELQHDFTENMGFLSWIIEGYDPVVDDSFNILTGRTKYGKDVVRIDKGMASSTSVVSYYKTDPFVLELLDRLEFDQVTDIGCGSGKRLLQVAERYPDIHLSGIDISEDCCELSRFNIAKAGRSDQINVVCSSAEDWHDKIDETCLRDGKNLIMCFAMFHDLMNIPGVAESMCTSICKNYPKGTLLMVQDQMRAESVRIGNNNWVEGFTFLHRMMGQSLYPVSQYEEVMKNNGLRIVETILTDITENYIILAEVI